jgi:hypothetical protein
LINAAKFGLYCAQYIHFEETKKMENGQDWQPSEELLKFIEVVPYIDLDAEENHPDILEKILRFALKDAEKDAKMYLQKNSGNSEKAIEKVIFWVMGSTITSGFASNLGGFIASMVLLSPDLAFSTYKNLKMIGIIAVLRGYHINDPDVLLTMKATLLGTSVSQFAKEAGVRLGVNLARVGIQKGLTRQIIVKINRLMGFRFLTKGGSKGVINAMKWVPIFGAVIGATVNGFESGTIANLAKVAFPENGILPPYEE